MPDSGTEHQDSEFNLMIEDLNRLIKKNSEIPTFRPVVEEIIKGSYKKSIPVPELIKLVSCDYILSSQVMKIVNSAYFNHPGTVSTIDEAMVILGYGLFQKIVFSFALYSVYSKTEDGYNPKIVKIWNHAFITGLTIRRLSELHTNGNSGAMFSAGLLHDIGKIVLFREFGAEYLLLMEKSNQEDVKLIKLEKEYFGYDHTEVGEALLRDYNLPEEIIFMVRYHHAPENYHQKDSRYSFIKAIYLSNILAHILELKERNFQPVFKRNDFFEKNFQFSNEEIHDILNLIRYDMKEEQKYINLLCGTEDE